MKNESSHTINANMPNSLNECIAPYPTTQNLYHMAARLKTLGEVLCSLIVILGLFNAASVADTMKDMSNEAAVTAFLSSVISLVFYAFIAYCAVRILSAVLEGFATIVQCRVIATKVALYNANSNDIHSND